MSAEVRVKREGKKLRLSVEADWPSEDCAETVTEADLAAVHVPASHPAVSRNRSTSSHSPDYASLNWFGTLYTFTPTQREVIALLYDAWKQGHQFMSQDALLELADSEGKRLRDIFRNSPAWGTLIRRGAVCGGPSGTYCLCKPQDVDA